MALGITPVSGILGFRRPAPKIYKKVKFNWSLTWSLVENPIKSLFISFPL